MDIFSQIINITWFMSILWKQEYIIYFQPIKKERIKLMFRVQLLKLVRMD